MSGGLGHCVSFPFPVIFLYCGLAATYKEANAEDADEQDLLLALKVQMPQHRKRQNEDRHICDNISSSVDIPEWEVGYAGAGN